jgi:hypothetical protein
MDNWEGQGNKGTSQLIEGIEEIKENSTCNNNRYMYIWLGNLCNCIIALFCISYKL